jgi:outer membrane protein assembly factor BamB
MTCQKSLVLGFFVTAVIVMISLRQPVHAASCDAIVGRWNWFIGGEVTVNPDGTFVQQQSGNDGTWQCTDGSRRRFTLRWRMGGYVNRLALSADGQNLSSTDPTQSFVSATRVGGASTEKPQPKTAEESGRAQADPSQTAPRLQWKLKIGLRSPPLVVSDGVVYATDGSELYALDARSGQKKWDVPLYAFTGKPAVAKGMVYKFIGSPAVAEGMVYLCDNSSVSARDSKTGRLVWKFEKDENTGLINAGPAVADGVLYFGAVVIGRGDEKPFGQLTALDSKTGRRRGGIKLGASVSSGPEVANGVVYFGTADGHLYALESSSLDPRTRSRPTMWSFKTGGYPSSPAIADDVVYVRSNDSWLYAVDVKTRQEKWRFKTGGKFPWPAIGGGIVYVNSGDTLYALDAKSGRERWKFKMGDEVSFRAIADGVVYIAGSDGYIYAIK